MSCSIEAENVFGPAVGSQCAGGFDFTLFFEEIFFSILPASVTFILLPLRLKQLLSRSPKVQIGALHHSKIILHALHTIIWLVMLIILGIHGLVPKTGASIPSAALNFGLFLIFPLLSHLEHTRSYQPSTILSLYLGTTSLFSIVQTRTEWFIAGNRLFSILFSVNLGIRVALLILESLKKTSNLKKFLLPSSEASSNVFSRNLFWWLNPLLWKGFRRILELETLPAIDEALNTPGSEERLHARWTSVRQKSSGAFVGTLFMHYKWAILQSVIPRLCLSAFTFAQPFLITRIVNFALAPEGELDSSIGSGLIAATALIYIGMAICNANTQHKAYRVITMMRGSLVSMIYTETLTKSVTAARDSAAVTLMSADVERAGTGLRYMHEIWASPIDLAIGFFLLERQLGVAAVAPGAIFLLTSLAALQVAGSMGGRQKLWLEAIQKRVTATSEMLAAMKEIRMAGLQWKMRDRLHGLRAQEITSSKAFKNALALIVCISYTTATLAPVFAFGMFELLARKNDTQTLGTEKAFTSLALFALLRAPMSLIIDAVAGFVSAIGALHRIGEYLSADETTTKNKEAKSSQIKVPSLSKRSNICTSSLTGSDSSLEEPPKALLLQDMFRQEKTYREVLPPNLNGSAVIAINASAGWSFKKPFVVRNLDFHIQGSSLTFIIGPVGSGKTTLLNAILGETTANIGTINVNFQRAAFCSQTPWLTNDSIRKNILGDCLWDKPWYDEVIRACVLEEDFRLLPKGDNEAIGGNGSTLSGGQQARVALARAVYSREQMIILDDVMSGLDAGTEDIIFDNLFGDKGLLRMLNTTVIFATNAIHRLASANHIILLDSDGTIAEQGTFDQLNQITKVTQRGSPDQSDSANPKNGSRDIAFEAIDIAQETIDLGLSDRRTGDTTVYKYYTLAVGVLNSAVFILFCCGFVFAFIFPQYLVKWWASENDRNPNTYLWRYIGGYFALGVMAIACLGLAVWQLTHRMMPRASEKFHDVLLFKTLAAPLTLFSETDLGITVNRFSQDLQLIDMELPLALFNTSVELLSCFGQLIVISISAKYIGAALPFVLAVFYLVQKFYLRTARQLRLLDIESKAPIFSKFLEALSGLVTIRSFGWTKYYGGRNQKTLDRSQRPFYLLYAVQRWLDLVLDLVVAGVAIIVMTIATKTKGSLDPGLIGVALVNIVNFSISIKTLLGNWTTLEISIGAVSRIRGFEKSTYSEHKPQEILAPEPGWPTQGSVVFENVTATWPGKSNPAINNLNLVIKPGEKFAICGRSGSGKSTIISSLLNLLSPSSGNISIDNVSLSAISRDHLRSALICVTQTPYLMPGTIRENIDPFGISNTAQIEEAIEEVQLSDFVSKLGGIDTIFDGSAMSVGQKQLISLARAMLRQGSILILDEATASLDLDTDDLVQNIIRERFAEHTIITIAHRLNTILDYDRIAVISDGHLVELNTPRNLLEREPSTMFADLYHISAGAAQVEVSGSSSPAGKQPKTLQRSRAEAVSDDDSEYALTPIMEAVLEAYGSREAFEAYGSREDLEVYGSREDVYTPSVYPPSYEDNTLPSEEDEDRLLNTHSKPSIKARKSLKASQSVKVSHGIKAYKSIKSRKSIKKARFLELDSPVSPIKGFWSEEGEFNFDIDPPTKMASTESAAHARAGRAADDFSDSTAGRSQSQARVSRFPSLRRLASRRTPMRNIGEEDDNKEEDGLESPVEDTLSFWARTTSVRGRPDLGTMGRSGSVLKR